MAAVSPPRVRVYVVASGLCLLGQVMLTDYGTGAEGAAGFWLVVGCVLLLRVTRRRGRFARAFIVVTSVAGAALFASVGLHAPHASAIAALYLRQAVPLLTPTISNHVSVTSSQTSP